MPPRKTDDQNQSDEAGGVSAEGEPNDKTQLQAREQTAADSSVSPKSSTLQNPDAEIRADLTQDVHAANRAAMSAEIRAADGRTEDLKTLERLHQAVADAQVEVDAAIAKRNAARDAYDREVEAQTQGTASFGTQVAEYVAAQNRQREAQAKLNEAALKRAST